MAYQVRTLLVDTIASVILAVSLFVLMQEVSFAQVAEPPLARLAELTYRKGYANRPFTPKIDGMLGILSGSIVYQAPYDTDIGEHICNAYKDHNRDTEPWHIVLAFIRRDHQAGTTYLTGPNAQLVRFLKGQKNGNDWSWTTIPTEQGKESFQQELIYWKTQEDVLAKEPDRVDPKDTKQ